MTCGHRLSCSLLRIHCAFARMVFHDAQQFSTSIFRPPCPFFFCLSSKSNCLLSFLLDSFYGPSYTLPLKRSGPVKLPESPVSLNSLLLLVTLPFCSAF